MTCWPLTPLTFASGDGVNTRSAQVSAELPYYKFPASTKFVSNLSFRVVIYVPGGTSSEAKTIEL